VKYELRAYIPEDSILHSDRRENLKSWKKNHALWIGATLLEKRPSVSRKYARAEEYTSL
jgi:hypothetical protein